jgi:hypothetical protein
MLQASVSSLLQVGQDELLEGSHLRSRSLPRAQYSPLRSKCDDSLSICVMVGEEPEIEVALV